MNVEKYLKTTKDNWFFNSFDGIMIIPETAVYKKGGKFDRYEFDYYKTCSRKYLDIIKELTDEANKLNLSQIKNILDNSKNITSKTDVIDSFYLDPSNWSGAVKDLEKRSEILKKVSEEVENLKKNSDVSYLRITILDDNLNTVKREYYTLFTYKGEVYLLNAVKNRKKELESEVRSKRGRDKRIQRIKEKRAEQRK